MRFSYGLQSDTRRKILLGFAIFVAVGVLSAAAAPPGGSKLDHRLRPIVGAQKARILTSLGETVVSDVVYIYVRLNTSDPSAVRELELVGFRTRAQFGGLVSGFLPPSRLLDLAALDVVSTVSPVDPPISLAVKGQVVDSVRANVVHNTPGFDGSGIKVGLISNSFALLSEATPTISDVDSDGIPEMTGCDSQLSGDVPAVIEMLQEAPFPHPDYPDLTPEQLGYDDEGRALAEIVYDIAPGVDIAYHAGVDIAHMAQGIVEMAEAGCKVIADDQFWLGQPIYQEGELSQAVERAAKDHDVVYVTAAGNSGACSVESSFVDINPGESDPADAEFPQKNDLHNWDILLRDEVPNSLEDSVPDGFLNIILPPGNNVRVAMYWENPYSGTLGPGASTDYDLYVATEPDLREDTLLQLPGYDGELHPVVSDNEQGTPQAPMGDPYEIVFIMNTSETETQTYYLALNLKHGPPANFKLIFIHNPRKTVGIQGDVRVGDTFMQIAHQQSKYALTVGAVNYLESDTGGEALGDPRKIEPTYYSGHGGVISILFSQTGEVLADPDQYFKPDICSVEGSNTSFFTGSGGDYPFDDDDLPNFLGTSAAVPCAAGVIALMRQANPSLDAKEVRRIARAAATDIYQPGVDSHSGWGLLYADKAVEFALNPPPPDTSVDDWMFQSVDFPLE